MKGTPKFIKQIQNLVSIPYVRLPYSSTGSSYIFHFLDNKCKQNPAPHKNIMILFSLRDKETTSKLSAYGKVEFQNKKGKRPGENLDVFKIKLKLIPIWHKVQK